MKLLLVEHYENDIPKPTYFAIRGLWEIYGRQGNHKTNKNFRKERKKTMKKVERKSQGPEGQDAGDTVSAP